MFGFSVGLPGEDSFTVPDKKEEDYQSGQEQGKERVVVKWRVPGAFPARQTFSEGYCGEKFLAGQRVGDRSYGIEDGLCRVGGQGSDEGRRGVASGLCEGPGACGRGVGGVCGQGRGGLCRRVVADGKGLCRRCVRGAVSRGSGTGQRVDG